MSVEAITWAFAQPVTHSSAKFVLVALANCADGRRFECYPSIDYLASVTGQNRKTVIDNIKRLVDDGFIAETGEKKGRTGKIKTYRLNVEIVPKTEPFNNPENGTVKQSQKRNSTKTGTVPKPGPLNSPKTGTITPLNDTENGILYTSNSPVFGHETVPKTGHVNVSEPKEEEKESAHAGACDSTPPVSAKQKKPETTFNTFVKRCKSVGEKPIADDDPIFDWAESAGIPEDWLRLVWVEFLARYRGSTKRYTDWPATFRNAVRNNWYRFWRASGDGFVLTTEGEMAARAAKSPARDRQQAQAVPA